MAGTGPQAPQPLAPATGTTATYARHCPRAPREEVTHMLPRVARLLYRLFGWKSTHIYDARKMPRDPRRRRR